MKKAFLSLTMLAVGFSAYSYYTYTTAEFVPEISTISMTYGDLVDTVGATGALEAVTTVQVGSQVSGIIQELSVDYNSIVKAGDVIMRLDPSLFETQIEQARANLLRAEAEVELLRVRFDDAQTQLARAQGLADRSLISTIELEAAQVAVRSAEAQLKSTEAQVTQARASLNQNEVNLEHTVIRAPIDGIVLSRLVDIGQTVAASLQAPELFIIAADLTKMRVIANIDESDVGRIRPGQRVTFTVDAYPTEEFVGSVSQIRLEPLVTQNVVTYATVINAPNDELKLKPGMTATINLEIARRENVARIPNSALRFRPTPQIFTTLSQVTPMPTQQGITSRRPMGRTVEGSIESPSGESGHQPLAGNFGTPRGDRKFRGQGDSPNSERRRQIQERLTQMSPEQRERFLAERRETRAATSLNRNPKLQPAESSPETKVQRGATTIDALFAPLPPVETTGRVWVMQAGQLQSIMLRLGVTDGVATELLGVIGSPQFPEEEDPSIVMLRQTLATLDDEAVRAELEQKLAQAEAKSRKHSRTAPPERLEAGTQLVTNVTTLEEDSGPAGRSPWFPRFGRPRQR